MNVLSLFDGISCGQVALQRNNIKVDKYYASEIDKYAIQITQNNYQNTIQLGDIKNWRNWNLENIDLILAGSPCQGFSNAGNGLNFNDPRSKLFFEFVDILNHYNPKYFLLENVKMKKEWKDIISSYVNVEPIEINSALVSAQNRKRLYWTNITNIDQPEDRNILLKDIIECEYNNLKECSLPKTKSRIQMWNGKCKNITNEKKSQCLTSKQDRWNNAGLIEFVDFCRFLTPVECERLQTLPDNYTKGVSNHQRYKCLGNAWTVDVISHILSCI